MGKLILNIDGYIGSWGYSQQWLKEMLSGHEKEEVIINISSLGGQVNHALSMHDQIKQHGNVTVNFTGFVASAATLIGMGAAKRRMSENALFLVHKVLSWIDEFGMMNEDDIDALIQRLEKEKNENAKITLVLANIYHRITGKSVSDILDLMKQDTWLNASEVMQWNFIDEIYSPGPAVVNLFEDLAKVAMVTSSGLPDPRSRFNSDLQHISCPENTNTPPATTNTPPATTNTPPVNENTPYTDMSTDQNPKSIQETLAKADSVLNNFFNRLASFITQKSNEMSKQFTNINAVLGVDSLNVSDQGLQLGHEQLGSIDQEIERLNTALEASSVIESALTEEQSAREAAQAELANETQAREAAEQERDNAQTENANLIALLDQISPDVAAATGAHDKVNAIRSLLAKKPGVAPVGALGTDSDTNIKNDGVDWETLNSLSHMQEDN